MSRAPVVAGIVPVSAFPLNDSDLRRARDAAVIHHPHKSHNMANVDRHCSDTYVIMEKALTVSGNVPAKLFTARSRMLCSERVQRR